jgi:hypothetical protein
MNAVPGDLAVIVRGRPANIGRLVRVLRDHGEVEYSEAGYGILPCWEVESLGGTFETSVGPATVGHTPNLSLRRLAPFTPEQEFEEVLAVLGDVMRGVFGDGRDGQGGNWRSAPGR